MPALPKGKGS